jgi:hypothetical protein
MKAATPSLVHEAKEISPGNLYSPSTRRCLMPVKHTDGEVSR